MQLKGSICQLDFTQADKYYFEQLYNILNNITIFDHNT